MHKKRHTEHERIGACHQDPRSTWHPGSSYIRVPLQALCIAMRLACVTKMNKNEADVRTEHDRSAYLVKGDGIFPELHPLLAAVLVIVVIVVVECSRPSVVANAAECSLASC